MELWYSKKDPVQGGDNDGYQARGNSSIEAAQDRLLYAWSNTFGPDIANPVHELSKALDGINQAAMKELLRVAKFVLDTKDLWLKIDPSRSIRHNNDNKNGG